MPGRVRRAWLPRPGRLRGRGRVRAVGARAPGLARRIMPRRRRASSPWPWAISVTVVPSPYQTTPRWSTEYSNGATWSGRTVISARPAGSASPSDSAGPWVICVESSSWSRSPTCSASPWKTTSKSPPNRPITGLMSPTACAVMSLATAWLTLTVTSWYPGTATGLEWIHALSGVPVERPFASAQNEHVGDGLGAGLAGERRGRQAHCADELGLSREVGAHGLGAFVERVSAGQQHGDAAGRSASTERSMK